MGTGLIILVIVGTCGAGAYVFCKSAKKRSNHENEDGSLKS